MAYDISRSTRSNCQKIIRHGSLSFKKVYMSTNPETSNSRYSATPWYLIWVFGAIILAAINLSEFGKSEKPGSAVIALAWLCWAFSWYTKPFSVNLRKTLSTAVLVHERRSWVSEVVWNTATFSAFALLLAGSVMMYANAA
jgi:hypothetical protein